MTKLLTLSQEKYIRVAQNLSSRLGRKFGVDIVLGPNPITDGKTVFLPHWDFNNPDARNALYGAIAHEAGGHVRMTDFDLLNDWFAQLKGQPHQTLIKSLVNVCEDVRIEFHLFAIYPGMKPFIIEALRFLKLDQPINPPEAYWDVVHDWLLFRFRSRLLRMPFLDAKVGPLQEKLLTMVDPSVMDRADALGDAILRIGKTKQDFASILDVVGQLYQLFDEARPSKNQPEPQTQPEQNNQGDGDAGSDDQTNPQPGDGDPQQGDPHHTGSSGPQPGDASSWEDPNGNSTEKAGGEGDDGTPTPTPEASDNTSDQVHEGSGNAASQPKKAETESEGSETSGTSNQSGDIPDQTPQQDGTGTGAGAGSPTDEGTQGQPDFSPIQVDESLPTKEQDVFGEIIKKATAEEQLPFDVHSNEPSHHPASRRTAMNVSSHLLKANAMKGRVVAALSPLLNGEVRSDVLQPRGRKMDARRIVRTRTDNPARVFKKKVVTEDQSLALQILVDRSSSTSGSVYDHITVATLGLAKALEAFPQVETMISHFPAQQSIGGSNFGHLVSKAFHDDVRSCLQDWPQPSGGTPLGRAYRSSALSFLCSEKERRVLIIITDGKPDSIATAQDAKDFAASLGVEIYGIVVGASGYPLGLFDDSEVITDASSLSVALSRLVLRLL